MGHSMVVTPEKLGFKIQDSRFKKFKILKDNDYEVV